ncbi:MAG TPA: hypothetical protein VKV21_09855 [Solirubrobacteraceae bacterium]|nr:hypothetical protein [Solirubrobacteraceae bacterium]
MTIAAGSEAQVVTGAEPLWFLGTLARIKLDGHHTGGRFALWDGELPRGAAPPLHSHPQDETLYVLDGEIIAWLVEPELVEPESTKPEPAGEGAGAAEWVRSRGRRCRAGAVVFAPGGVPHTFRVESDTARLLFVSTPAGIEEYVRALAEPARWPWLQPPPDGPRVPAERLATVERECGVVRHGPPPPAA